MPVALLLICRPKVQFKQAAEVLVALKGIDKAFEDVNKPFSETQVPLSKPALKARGKQGPQGKHTVSA
jgi:hypothetical protein